MIDVQDIPDYWSVKTIDEVCEYIQRGKQPEYDDENGRVKIINQRCIYWDGLRLENARKLDRGSEEDWQEYRYLQRGDVLVNSTGVGTLGRAQIWDVESDVDYVVDGHVTILRSNDKVTSEYLFRFLSSPIGQNQIKKYTRGATGQTELYKKHITDIELPIPPLDEQERIVEAVEERLEYMKRLEKSVKSVGRLADEYKSSLLAYLLTGMSEEGIENLGSNLSEEQVPDDWSVKKVSEVVSAKNGGTPKRSEERYWGGEIDWLSSGEIRNKYTSSAEESINQLAIDESSAKMFPKNSVLVAMYGKTRAQSTIITKDMSGNQAICCLQPDDEIIPEYLFHFYEVIEDKLASKGRGAGQQNLNQSMVVGVNIPIPPHKEQNKIVNKIDSYDFTKVRKSSQSLNELFKEYRDSVLSYAFEGKIDC